MSIKRDLKREGIEVIGVLDTLTINSLAKNIAYTLSQSFPKLNLDVNKTFSDISRLNMYLAKLPNGISAKYFYKNKSIYFDYTLEKTQLSSVALHECIHYLQERKDNSGDIIRLGLCDYTSGNLTGTGLNEAAVQLMSAKALDNEYENVRYFDIDITTNTPNYYPLECTLVNQMAYIIGEDVLFDSTINANDNFKKQFISLTSEKVFYTIQKNIDLLVESQENLSKIYFDLEQYDIDQVFIKKSIQESEKQKEKIKKIFADTQKLILASYFDNAINLVYSPKLIDNYRNKLYAFKNLIGDITGDNFYNDYYIDKMMELEKRYDIGASEIKDLVVVKNNFISIFIRKLKTLFGFNPEYAEMRNIK